MGGELPTPGCRGSRVGATGSADPTWSSTSSNWEARWGWGRGQEMFLDRSGAGGGEGGGGGAPPAWPPGRGRMPARWGTARVARRPQNSASAARTVAPSKGTLCHFIIRLQIGSAGIRLAKAPQDSGKEIFIFSCRAFWSLRAVSEPWKSGESPWGLLRSSPAAGMGSALPHFLGTLLFRRFFPRSFPPVSVSYLRPSLGVLQGPSENKIVDVRGARRFRNLSRIQRDPTSSNL